VPLVTGGESERGWFPEAYSAILGTCCSPHLPWVGLGSGLASVCRRANTPRPKPRCPHPHPNPNPNPNPKAHKPKESPQQEPMSPHISLAHYYYYYYRHHYYY
jgi:hypothetical protein